MHYDFELAGRRVRLWQRPGEGYAHVLMKALGFAMFVGEYPELEIERRVGLRYKPDLVAETNGGARRFAFWGECGLVSVRKVAWLLKHGSVERLVLFKTGFNVAPLAFELRGAIDERYRPPGRLSVVNFSADIAALAADRRVGRVPPRWYTTTVV
ncbi:MAG TPA: hypothetical protein VGV38_18205 [Pyrinomonadaceae bacterium]|nr:hypothetical protein [Pyrinomonadaceae bacterium]